MASKQEKASKKLSKKIRKQSKIRVKGYYNFYSVPWDDSLYIKLRTKYILVGGESGAAFEIHAYNDLSEVNEKRQRKFMKDNYLGSARLTDDLLLKRMLGNRKELKLP